MRPPPALRPGDASRCGNELDVTEPPSLAALLERCKPSAQRIKREYDSKPDRVDADEAETIAGGLVMRQDANKPRHIARRQQGKQQSERMEQVDMRHVIQERHASE